jgi:hypothetical protein
VERTDHNIKGDVRNFGRPVTTSMHKLGENKDIDVSTINAGTIQQMLNYLAINNDQEALQSVLNN